MEEKDFISRLKKIDETKDEIIHALITKNSVLGKKIEEQKNEISQIKLETQMKDARKQNGTIPIKLE